MQLPDDVHDDLRKRLRRAEGQIRGVQAMLEEGRECRDIVTQLAAVRTALGNVGVKLLATGMAACLADPELAEANGFTIDEVEKLFTKLS
jgi:DNA-binding FrmR family transcriptional regulator